MTTHSANFIAAAIGKEKNEGRLEDVIGQFSREAAEMFSEVLIYTQVGREIP